LRNEVAEETWVLTCWTKSIPWHVTGNPRYLYSDTRVRVRG